MTSLILILGFVYRIIPRTLMSKEVQNLFCDVFSSCYVLIVGCFSVRGV